MKKRGQITLFIILGILILIAVFSFFYIRSTVVKKAVIEEIPTVVKIPLEFEPIRLFTQECLEKVGTEAVKILGEQGGYIDLEEFGITTSSTNPTEADALEFAPETGLNIPYWWYLKASNKCQGNCLFSSLRPSLHRASEEDGSIESQIDNYIEREIKACLNEYNAFKIQGFNITPTGELDSRTRVTSNDVLLLLEYPLKVKLQDKDAKISDFYATVPVNLRKIYQFATDITNAQIEHKFFEKQMLDLINAFSGLDANRLPPVSATTFGTERSLTWLEADVKDKLQEILMIYVPAFQIYNTLNFRKRYLPDPIQAAIYQASELPINLSRESRPYSDLAVSFSYLAWWPIYFDVNSRGGIIKGQTAINDLAEIFSLGTTRYNTVYDLSYPVVVEIYDPAALKEKGYVFRFALESNFRNNEPIDESFRGFEGITVPQSSLLCNENQRNSGDVSIKIIDAVTKKPIEGVHIGFKCGEEGCQIDNTNENGSLISKFPVCAGGLLVIRHPDYYTPTLYLSTLFNRTVDMPTIGLYPYISKEVNIIKYAVSTREKKLIITPASLDPADEVMAVFIRINDFEGDSEHVAVAQITENATSSLNLVPGTYEVSLDLIYHKLVVIPEDEREEGTWPFVEEYTIPEVRFDDNYMKGGAVLDKETGYLVVSPEKLYKNSSITLYVLDTGIPQKVEQINDPDKVKALSASFRGSLEPTFS